MMKTLIVLLLLSLSVQAQEFRVDQLRGIKIIGWKGHLTITADPKVESVRHRFTQAKGSAIGTFTTSATVEEGWLNLKVTGPSAKQDWRSEIPKIDLEIRSKSLPLVISWVDGDVTIKSWAAPVRLTHKSGKVKIEDGKEAWKLSLHEGELDVMKFAGNMDIDSYASRLAIRKLEGRVKIENFQGRLTMDESKGDVILKTVQGKNTIEDLAGTFDFDNNKGEIFFSQTEGTVQGKSQAGIIDGKIKGAVEVRIRGDEPRLNLQLAKGTGARIDLGTSKGTISSGLPLKSERLENLKLLRGQISGTKLASVFVRLQNGDIRMK
jgi:hypothetical protein